jgi:DNA invertase Pin-like site-specific DNA recombinase
MLCRYVREQGWNEVEVYCDDGYSGTNFQRPAVQRMIEDAKSGRINIIVVKDLSRFGRNYIEIGQYTDYLFPQIGCRFIALGNGVDTLNQSSSNDMMGFLNLFNEFYSRDTSKKVKAVKKACAENGKYLGTYAPFGYRKDPQDKHHLLVDEETAPIVRRIFDLRSGGLGFRAIACLFNEEGVLTPGAVYYQRKNKPDNRRVNHCWADSTVAAVLRNEVYIGNMVQGKNGTVSYKCKKLIAKPKEDWIRVEGTHEAIISPEIWATVTALDEQRFQKREVTGETPSPFTGLMYCADCGFKMSHQREKDTRKDGSAHTRHYFLCGNYRRSGKSACTIHSVNENMLTDLVLADIREKALAVTHDEKRIIEQIVRQKAAETDSRLSGYERELRAALARQPEIERLMMTLYEDRIKGMVPETVFATLMKKYETQQAEIAAVIPDLQTKIQNSRQCYDNTAMWIKHIRNYTGVTAVDDALLIELIERIEVGEAKMIDGKRYCDVKIIYRYVGDVDEAVALVKKEAA